MNKTVTFLPKRHTKSRKSRFSSPTQPVARHTASLSLFAVVMNTTTDFSLALRKEPATRLSQSQDGKRTSLRSMMDLGPWGARERPRNRQGANQTSRNGQHHLLRWERSALVGQTSWGQAQGRSGPPTLQSTAASQLRVHQLPTRPGCHRSR